MSTNSQTPTPGESLLHPETPFYVAKLLAEHSRCDLAVSNGQCGGLGDVLVFTPVVEEYARRLGRRIRLLSAPFSPQVGLVAGELNHPIWLNNPFISEIVDARQFGADAVRALDLDRDNCCQCSHVIENICASYGLSSRRLRPSLYLGAQEQAIALESLRDTASSASCPAKSTVARNKGMDHGIYSARTNMCRRAPSGRNTLGCVARPS